MKKGIFGLLVSVFLLFAGAATAAPVEVVGGLNVTGTPGTDGVTFPDNTTQTTAATGTVTSVGTGGGLTGGPITTTGTISIAPGGVTDSMLATGISASKINGNISGNAASITGSISESQIIKPKAPVLSSGQMITYAAGDDGNFKWGAAVSTRFTDNGNGTVTDNLTSLIWLKDASVCIGTQTWANALAQADGLANGACGLTDGSAAGDWRLPNINELETLVDASQSVPALPTGNPFTNVQSSFYWSSTTYAPYTAYAWYVIMSDGYVVYYLKSNTYYVWPVRGGQ